MEQSTTAKIIEPGASSRACVPNKNDFNAYGFYRLAPNTKALETEAQAADDAFAAAPQDSEKKEAAKAANKALDDLKNARREIDFGLYSRIQYYSLTPRWDGNIQIPENWGSTKVTQRAHDRGTKVDLVISNAEWFWEEAAATAAAATKTAKTAAAAAKTAETAAAADADTDAAADAKAAAEVAADAKAAAEVAAKTNADAGYKYTGLWLNKSYVSLSLTDDIVSAVKTHNFDGVTIDFRLPQHVRTVDSYTAFINRLKKRLKEATDNRKESDLLETQPLKLNIVIDDKFIKTLVVNYRDRKQQSASNNDAAKQDDLRDLSPEEYKKIALIALMELLGNVSEAVNLVFVGPDVDSDLAKVIPKISVPENAKAEGLMIKVDTPTKIPQRLGSDAEMGRLGVWDVTQLEEGQNEIISKEVFGFTSPLELNSRLVCTSRNGIANTLVVLGPFLALMVLLSWVFYDFPPEIERLKWLKRSTIKLIIWGLLAIAVVGFFLLWIGLPSHNFSNIKFYIILGSFVVPIAFIVSSLSSKLSERDYP